METAGSIVKDALGEITVLGAEAPLEAVDGQLAVRYLNRMMAAFDADGISLGYTEVSQLDDAITVAAGAIAGMISQLGVMLWDHFSDGQPVPPTLLARAISGKNTMRKIAIVIIPSQYPSTLPIGSGNESDYGRESHFYPDQQDSILTEANQNIVVEDNT